MPAAASLEPSGSRRLAPAAGAAGAELGGLRDAAGAAGGAAGASGRGARSRSERARATAKQVVGARWGERFFFCSCHGENGLDGKVGAVCRLVFLRGFLFKVGVKGTPKECNCKFDGRCPYFQKHPYHGRWVWFSSMSWKEPCKPAQVLGV